MTARPADRNALAGPTVALPPFAPRRALALAPFALGACLLALLAVVAWSVALSFADGVRPPPIRDFDVFRIAGDLAARGRLAEAYDWPAMERLQGALGRSRTGYLPFAYPPAFGLAMVPLGRMPVGAAYAVFVALGFAPFALALRRLSPGLFWPTVLALGPVLLVNVAGGQNGMLTAGLAGLAAAAGLAGRDAGAGSLAGLAVALKPQTACGPPLFFALRRNWRALAAAAAALAAASGLAVAVAGPQIVPAFLDGLSETGRGLAANRLPLHRMVTVYACLRSLGVPTGVALPVHAATALAAVGAVLFVGRSAEPRESAGLALMATAFASPYFYDYDLTVVGLGLATALSGRGGASPWRGGALLALLALAGSAGALQSLFLPSHLSIGAPVLAALFAACLTGQRRAQRAHAPRT